MKRLLICAVLMLAAIPLAAAAQEPQPGGVTVAVDPVQPVKVGQQFTLTYRFGYEQGTKLYFPDRPVTAPFVFVTSSADRPGVLGTGTSESHSITLMAVKAGSAEMAPFDVPVVLADGTTGMVRTPAAAIEVVSTIGNENDPQVAQFATPAPLIVRNDLLLWILGAVLVAAVAAAAGILGYRRYRAWVLAHTPPPPPEPAHVTAYRRLAEIEAMGLIDAFRFKELALLLSEVVREFLGARLGFPGSDSTTWETLDFVKAAGPGGASGRLDPAELEDFLSLCDLIKFAKFQPTVADGAALLKRGRGIVDRVMNADDAPAVATITAEDRGGEDAV